MGIAQNRMIRVTGIVWDTDGERVEGLPSEVGLEFEEVFEGVVEEPVEGMDAVERDTRVLDYIMDEAGWLIAECDIVYPFALPGLPLVEEVVWDTPTCRRRMAWSSRTISLPKERMQMGHHIERYLIRVWGCVEPELYGPFSTQEGRDSRAVGLHGEEHALIKLFLVDGVPSVEPYGHAELQVLIGEAGEERVGSGHSEPTRSWTCPSTMIGLLKEFFEGREPWQETEKLDEDQG